MKTRTAWRRFQEAVLRHPFCRFTILPAAISLAICLVAPCLVLAMWAWGGREAWSAAQIVNGCGGWLSLFIMLAVGLTGGLLTGRWQATLAGLITTWFALESRIRPKKELFYYAPADGTESIWLIWLLVVFSLAGLWLFSLDRRKTADWPVLSRPLKLLGVAALVGIMVAAGWLRYYGNEWLLALSAAIWFTVFFNLAWRLGETKAGRFGYGLFVLGTMALYVGLARLLHDYMGLRFFFQYSLAPLAAIGLAILSCLPWAVQPAPVKETPDPAAGRLGKPFLAMVLGLGVFLGASLGLGLLKARATQRLFAVCRAGTPEQVQTAITTWASVNARDINGQTPLMMAARTNPHAPVITVLQRAGAEVNAEADGCTPLFDAIQNNQDPKVVVALIQAGAKVNAKIAGGLSVLEYTQRNNNPELINLLIQAGAK